MCKRKNSCVAHDEVQRQGKDTVDAKKDGNIL
jgi:hypothetical protein